MDSQDPRLKTYGQMTWEERATRVIDSIRQTEGMKCLDGQMVVCNTFDPRLIPHIRRLPPDKVEIVEEKIEALNGHGPANILTIALVIKGCRAEPNEPPTKDKRVFIKLPGLPVSLAP